MTANVDKVYEAIRASNPEPITTAKIAEVTGLRRSTVQYACTILVQAGKIARYLGVRGVFVLSGQEAIK